MKRLLLISLLLAGRLLAQPVITTQPTNQFVLNGSNVTFNVAVSGTGPFTYQWQFNGTNLPNDLIVTVAGNSIGGFSGDGGVATMASLNRPLGVTVDRAGNLYIADNYNSLIRKVDTNGIITTVAGNGTYDYSGDGGTATNASLRNPAGIATDTFGNIYFADSSNNRIRKVNASGVITTVAGNGINGFSGDGGAAINASLYAPLGVAVDSAGNLYIADASNNRVRKVGGNGLITTVAGTGNSDFAGDGGLAINADVHQPFGVAVDNAGNLYIAESSSERIRKVDTNGIITTVAGNGFQSSYTYYVGDGGAATNATLFEPYGVAIDNSGNVFIADTFDDRVRKVDANGIISTLAGGGVSADDNISAANANLSAVEGVAVDADGNIFIADTFNNRVREVVYPGPRLTLNNLTTNNAGDYCVVISNSSGSVTSNIAHLTVVLPPSITTQPQNQQIVAGTNAGFSVLAGGTEPLSYQWQFNGNNIDSATNANYLIGSATFDFAGSYSVIITNAYGSVTSSIAALTISALNIAVQPQSQRILAGSNVTFSVSVSSTLPVSYQWQINGTNIDGAAGSNYAISLVTTDYAGDYSVIITNSYGSVTSSIATLTVAVVDITTQPRNQSILSGSNVTFSVSGNSTQPVNYQWQFNGTNIVGATNAVYSIAPVTPANAGNYTVILTNIYGSITSSVAVLTVLVLPPSIITQPLPQEVHPGGSATFGVTASGTAPLSYQWLFGSVVLDGQTNSILTLPNVLPGDAGAYSVVITNAYGSITSRVALLVVGYPPIITLQPTNQSALVGSRTLIVAGANGDGPLTFQWQLNGTNLPNNLITTVAGNGTSGFAGDGGIATTGNVNFPYGVAADNAGNVFIADSGNYRIRKVDPNGVMTTVAGKGQAAFSGDGGAATNARLNTSYGIAVDGMGNLFIADTYNNRIRKVDTNGIINTVAGKSGSGFSGDGGSATNATLYYPYGVMVDTNGNLFIADTYNNRIRKVDTNGIITTIAGKSSSGFSGDGGAATNASLYRPQSLAMDGNGNLFIADAYNYRVRQVDVYGVITTIAGNGSTSFSGDNGVATNAGMNPSGVSVDGYGDVLIADRSNNRIRRVDPYGIITTVAGTNSYGYGGDGVAATNAPLYYPSGVAMDGYGRILIADTYNNRIRRFGQGPTLVLDRLTATDAGNYTLVVNSSYGSVTSVVVTLTVLAPPSIVVPPASQTIGLGSNATFAVTLMGTEPLAYQWQFNGTNLMNQTGQFLNLTNVQWSDAGNYQVVITNNYGSITSAVATMTVGLPPAIASQPTNQIVLVGSNGQLSVVVTGDGPFTYQWRLNGTNLPPIITTVAGTNGSAGYSGDGGMATNAKLNFPEGVAIDAAGNLFIADYSNNRIRKVDTNGIITTTAGTGTQGNSGNGGLAVNATLYRPAGVTFDAAGNLYISEYGNGDVRKVGTNGIITRVAGTGTVGTSNDGGQATNSALYSATGAALDSNGNLYINESAHCHIRKVGTNGIITTMAGNTDFITGGFSGDGGLATNAQLNAPYGIALDSLGNLFIADTANNRVRKVDTNGIINTVVGGGSSSSDGLLGTNTLLSYPYGVGLDRYNNLFITTGSRVRKMDTNGIMTTVAGGGNSNPGDYGPATSAQLGSPRGVGFDTQGNLDIADTGYNRIRKVHFSGDPTLQLLNASVTNSGNYSVLIASPFGSVVSSVANLTVVAPPTIQMFSLANGQFNLTWSTVSNLTYQLQYTLDLSTTNWIDLGNAITATNGSVTVSDVPGADSQRFYRIKMN